MSFNIGENVGPYRIIEQLGQGGMATVYKAYHAALDRYVALKVLHPAFHQDQTFTARFQREARVVARLEHPNIVPIYDYSEHEMRPYLVMKYIEGDTLKARFSAGPLSSAEIEKVVSSVGSALAYAHKQGVWHRDIKPSNVLLATDGVMYLADFGLARIAEAGESTLSSDSIMGTPQYISPEQAMGSKDLDAGTDIYSFGVMLYEMVVGQVPFSADTPFSIIHDHIYTPLPLPMDINPKVPEPVQRVLMKALAKQRADRYESVDEMCNAFRAAWTEAGVPMQGTGITMRPGSLKKAAAEVASEAAKSGETAVAKGPKKQRSAWPWVAAGLLLILCVAAVAVGIRSRRLLNREPTATQAVTAPVIVPEQTSIVISSPLPNPTLQGSTSAEVAEALEEVTNDPANPDAHLDLSLAYWNIGEKRLSMEELAQAANLAGPTNQDFFLEAAEEYKGREAWIPSAGMYLRLVSAYSGEELPLDVDIENDFHEAVYKASEQKEMPLFVFFERIDSANLPLGYIARGRYALFNGRIEDATAQLNNAAKVRPNMYEVFLLRAEIAVKSEDFNEARGILLSLSSDLGAPEWIRFFANNLLSTIQ
jgi:tRNA A-37 threonylcarbamoyl transferase component Bud32/tetratricopeptide (TPR) repeat protein